MDLISKDQIRTAYRRAAQRAGTENEDSPLFIDLFECELKRIMTCNILRLAVDQGQAEVNNVALDGERMWSLTEDQVAVA